MMLKMIIFPSFFLVKYEVNTCDICLHLQLWSPERQFASCLLPVLQRGDPFPVLVWTVAGHFLFKSSGNLPAECHYLVFLCGLNYCRHLVSNSTVHSPVRSAAGHGVSWGRRQCKNLLKLGQLLVVLLSVITLERISLEVISKG